MLNPLNDVRNLKDPLKQFVCNMTLAFPANSQLNQYIDVKDLEDGTTGVSVAGRIVFMRKMGKMSFVTISDIK